MPRDPIPTWCFAVVVVRKGDRFLLVHERKHGQLWYLPAGRVEPGERFEDAAVRETREEAGIDVRLTGIVRIQHTPRGDGARQRVIFLAEPVGDQEPKSRADEESLEARWVPLQELQQYPLRGDDVLLILRHVEAGGLVVPMSLLTQEGTW